MITESISDRALIDTPEENLDISQDLVDLLALISNPKSTSYPTQTWQAEVANVNQSDPPDSNKRKHNRLPLHWRAAIVNKGIGKNEIYHGRTNDLSLSFVSILIEHNVFFTSEVVLLLAIPPMHQGQKETILETHCSTSYTLLDSVHGQFRVGMRIKQFIGNGKATLAAILWNRRMLLAT